MTELIALPRVIKSVDWLTEPWSPRYPGAVSPGAFGRIEWRGESWAIQQDGASLVAVRTDHPDIPKWSHKDRLPFVLQMLDAQPAAMHATTLGELKRWAGRKTYDFRYTRALGLKINRCCVATVLNNLFGSSDASVGASNTSYKNAYSVVPMLYIDSAEWRVRVAGLADSADTDGLDWHPKSHPVSR